jgi:hypothetical protein
MASRPKPIPRPRLSSTGSAHKSPSAGTRPSNRTTRRWRRDVRPTAVRAAVSATKALHWTRPLIEAILEELYVDDHFEELLGRAPGDLRSSQYAQAIAVALILRHSWHPDDLACMIKRLQLRVGKA